jgi:bifunctional DNase/RNase
MRSALAIALLLSSMAGSSSAAAPPAGEDTTISMSVRTVGLVQGSNVVLLETANGKTLLPIWIGSIEAQAIDQRLNHRKPPRPLTHDLLETVLATLGARVERIEIDDLRDNTFFGKLTLRDARGVRSRIDARPSDLISLAIGAGLPILVAPHVLEQAGVDAHTLQP